ncbi:amino acid transporter [Xylariaceae sp. FL0016]|nr:amino acid transporter [Xylariaceae sp. FL0016]
MRTATILGAVLSALQMAEASPLTQRNTTSGTCTTNKRKAWSALTDVEKKAYIDAELCLQSSPPQLDIDGAVNRWDELVYGHVVQSNVIHNVGAFLPWHRLYMRAHEILLQTECNYTGAQPYWDELSDVTDDALENASIFDVNTGFGNGSVDDDGCVTTGPFVNLTLHINQTSNYDNSCLKRDLNQQGFNLANSTYLDECRASQNYSTAFECYMVSPHVAGHSAIGTTMLDVVASPGEPLFFLHHTYLDRVWWQWQQDDLSTRLTDMGGRNIPYESYLEDNDFDYPGADILDYDGDDGNVTTLNHNLWMVGLIANATIADVMDLGGDLICAEYID